MRGKSGTAMAIITFGLFPWRIPPGRKNLNRGRHGIFNPNILLSGAAIIRSAVTEPTQSQCRPSVKVSHSRIQDTSCQRLCQLCSQPYRPAWTKSNCLVPVMTTRPALLVNMSLHAKQRVESWTNKLAMSTTRRRWQVGPWIASFPLEIVLVHHWRLFFPYTNRVDILENLLLILTKTLQQQPPGVFPASFQTFVSTTTMTRVEVTRTILERNLPYSTCETTLNLLSPVYRTNP